MSLPQYGPTCVPSFTSFFGGKTPEPTHDGCPGGSNTPGLIGGWTCPCACHQKEDPKQAERLPEEGRILPPYGGVTKCANEPCQEMLSEEHGAYLHTNRESRKLLVLCGPCSRQAQMNDALRFPLVAL